MTEAEQTKLLLAQASEGDPKALDELFERLHTELRELARGKLQRERAGHTLQATALVNELYLKLGKGSPMSAQSREEFLCSAARCMRQILVDHARYKKREKRGGNAVRHPLTGLVHFDHNLLDA